MTDPLWAVLPGGVDDPAAPSGGNRYDREVLSRLRSEQGIAVREILAPGSWPVPSAEDASALARSLGGLPDGSVVLLDGLVACGVPAVLLPHAQRLRLIVLVHLPLSDEIGLDPAEAGRLRGLERETLHLARAVIATSSQAADHLRTMHGLSQVLVAEPGVGLPGPIESGNHVTAEPTGSAQRDTAAASGPGSHAAGPADPDGSRLLCVAAVTPRKGQDIVVAALEGHLRDLEWTCTFAGAIRSAVGYTHENIRFVGPLVGGALDDAYRKADLFVLASRAETYGMVVTEALARGLPVVAAAVGGIPEALGLAPGGELPGALVPPDDPEALATTLRAWLTDAELRRRWRAAARARRGTLRSWSDTTARIATYVNAARAGSVSPR